MIIAWRGLRWWEIVVFWAVIVGVAVFTVGLADAAGPAPRVQQLVEDPCEGRGLLCALDYVHLLPSNPCDNQGPLCVVA